jgi:chromosome segregation ATPase
MANLLSADLERRKKQWSESRRLAEEAETLQNEKARLSARKFTIYDDYRSGNSSREKYLHDLEQIRERLAEIETLIPGLEQQIKEADKKMEGVNEAENHLADIAALQSFDKETLSKVIERVYVYGADRVEIVWKTDDIFFSEEMPEKRKVINPAEMPLMNETPVGA